MTLYAGASGFSYPTWRPGFYPADARPADFLRLYGERLPSVELNTTGYRLPGHEQFRRWAGQTTPGFRVAVKLPGHRAGIVSAFSEHVSGLGDRLGPVRVVLGSARDEGMIELLVGSLDPSFRLAFDLRHPSWEGIEPRLAEVGAVRVDDLEADAPFRYVRLREPPYDDAQLAAWAGRIRPLLAEGVDVYCYFKHEDEPTAPAYAERLLAILAPWSKHA